VNPPLTRLLPAPAGPTSVLDAYDVERAPRPDRPWIGLCMVASLDGSVAVDGTSGALGNPNDLEVLLTLRDLADMVIVGAGTVRGEGYGPPRRADRRIGVATNSGRVDLETELFTSGAGFLLAPESAEIDESAVEVLRAGATQLDLVAAIGRLDEVMPGATYVQAEGGPRLNAALLEADLVDELDLSISPRMVGGDGPRLVVGADGTERRFDLAHLLADDDGFVFSRWTRRAATSPRHRGS
jgi:riboflavin biosynthesis pyrimidine reductase